MIKLKISDLIKKAGLELDLELPTIHLEHPEIFSHGDFATNVALAAAKSLGKSPKDIAEQLKNKILEIKEREKIEEIMDVEVAGPGFLNFHLSRDFFARSIEEIILEKDFGKGKSLSGKSVLFEYTDPNPFKPFHIGHLMSNSIGETLSRIAENAGAKVLRANYQGDVGLHVAKAIYGILHNEENWKEKFESLGSSSRIATWIGGCYAEGSTAYEEDLEAKKEIDTINKSVYLKNDERISHLYDEGRKVTLEAFEPLYKKLGTKFDYYFFESEMAAKGLDIVKKNTPSVFEESEGAIVFHAEKHDSSLHTRVFITGQGLPAYEAKELGLAMIKFEKINPDTSITITAVEQKDYMRVVTSALRQINSVLAGKMHHITHGMMRFAEGKMSSRKGNIITGESFISQVEDVVLEKIKERDIEEGEKKDIAEKVAIAAIKYSILRQSPGKDIIFDKEKALSFEGDSGPYLQYAFVRTQSLLEKAKEASLEWSIVATPADVTDLERLLYRFVEVADRASFENAPQIIVEYLTSLASAFNSFYAQGLIVTDTPEAPYKVALTKAFSNVMEKGLGLLAIPILKKM